MKKQYVDALLQYYREHGRTLPWRSDPTPYHVWISEIMLQQTRVEAVKEYYHRFLKRCPDIETLSRVPLEELQVLWQGLGYYSRIRNIHLASQIVMNHYQGKLPDDYDSLRSLPGIGEYTAKAILSIAYQKKEIAVDGNLLRVYARLMASNEDIRKNGTKKNAEAYFHEYFPERPGDFVQALMDLGEMVCLPNGMPLCEKCPLSSLCLAHHRKTETCFPMSTKKQNVRTEEKTILLFVYQDEVRIQKREDNGLLASLYEFCTLDGKRSFEDISIYLKERNAEYSELYELEPQCFLFTHRRWEMTGYLITLAKRIDGQFVPFDRLKDYSIPNVFSYYRSLLLNQAKVSH